MIKTVEFELHIVFPDQQSTRIAGMKSHVLIVPGMQDADIKISVINDLDKKLKEFFNMINASTIIGKTHSMKGK